MMFRLESLKSRIGTDAVIFSGYRWYVPVIGRPFLCAAFATWTLSGKGSSMCTMSAHESASFTTSASGLAKW